MWMGKKGGGCGFAEKEANYVPQNMNKIPVSDRHTGKRAQPPPPPPPPPPPAWMFLSIPSRMHGGPLRDREPGGGPRVLLDQPSFPSCWDETMRCFFSWRTRRRVTFTGRIGVGVGWWQERQAKHTQFPNHLLASNILS